ncbi:MAG: MBL fold metallo-hydrolase [Rubricoccaceae bacterium]
MTEPSTRSAVPDRPLPEGSGAGPETPSEPSAVAIRFWGVRGSIPVPEARYLGVGGNTACVHLRGPRGTHCILDAGTGARALGAALAAEAGRAPLDLHVLFSHFHWDHIQGLPFFAPLYTAGNRVTFYSGHDPNRLRGLLSGQMSGPYFPVPFEALSASMEAVTLRMDAPTAIGEFAVTAFGLNHPQGACGYRITCEDRLIVYASDHEHGHPEADATLRRAAEGADVLICDAQFTPEEYTRRQGWGHTTWQHAAELATHAAVDRLFLFHHDPAHDDAALARILECARAVFPQTDLATEQTRLWL